MKLSRVNVGNGVPITRVGFIGTRLHFSIILSSCDGGGASGTLAAAYSGTDTDEECRWTGRTPSVNGHLH